ncbi:MAG: DUF5765 domain-containing protein [bacterium]|nr:DUF5765 domain-containing protein [bacterium]
MCWSGPYSAALATAGFAGSYWSYKKGHQPFRYVPLMYFSAMETLQAITYSVIDDCGNSTNTTLTYLSFIHIAFQPFFVNMFAMSWLPTKLPKVARRMVWGLCAFATIIFLLMLTKLERFGSCNSALQLMCGTDTCSYHGEWHIAWRLTLNNLDPFYLTYWITAFIVPLLYGSWRFTTYHFVVGPLLAKFLTTNKDERPAIWCLMSILFLSATHIPQIRRWMSGGKKTGEKPDGE